MDSTKSLPEAAKDGNLRRFKKLALDLDTGKGLGKTIASAKDNNGRGAIHFAAAEGMIEVCKYLVDELKLDVDLKDGKGQTPLAHSTFGGHLSTTLYFLKKGADAKTSDNTGLTPVHLAAEIACFPLYCYQAWTTRGRNPCRRLAVHTFSMFNIVLPHSCESQFSMTCTMPATRHALITLLGNQFCHKRYKKP